MPFLDILPEKCVKKMEEEVDEKDQGSDKLEKETNSQVPENQDEQNDDKSYSVRRNTRVRQKNRYFLDFHCVDLTKGGKGSNKDDYDTFTTSSSTKSSNREQDEEPALLEKKYCRKCMIKTAHDVDAGCQPCLYKKIVETVKRQRPANQKQRSNNSAKQNHNQNNTEDKIENWSPDEVYNFIHSKGFRYEAESFKLHCVDGLSLLLMQRTDFTYGLKLKLGPALKIYDQVCKLKKEYFKTLCSKEEEEGERCKKVSMACNEL